MPDGKPTEETMAILEGARQRLRDYDRAMNLHSPMDGPPKPGVMSVVRRMTRWELIVDLLEQEAKHEINW